MNASIKKTMTKMGCEIKHFGHIAKYESLK